MRLAEEEEAGSDSNSGQKACLTPGKPIGPREKSSWAPRNSRLPFLFTFPQMAKSLGLMQEARCKCQFSCDAQKFSVSLSGPQYPHLYNGRVDLTKFNVDSRDRLSESSLYHVVAI